MSFRCIQRLERAKANHHQLLLFAAPWLANPPPLLGLQSNTPNASAFGWVPTTSIWVLLQIMSLL